MGTRAHVFVYQEGSPIVNIYSHWDGGPSNLGRQLGEILKDRKLVSGIPNVVAGPASNGMCCLAATIVSQLKTAIGDYYLYPISSTSSNRCYEYHLYENQVVVMQFVSAKSVIFSGSWNEFFEFCKDGASRLPRC